MTEDEEREIRPDILKMRIDGLEWLVSILIGTLSDDQRGYLEERLGERANALQDTVKRLDTDPARDKAAIAYDLETEVKHMSEDSAGGYSIYLE